MKRGFTALCFSLILIFAAGCGSSSGDTADSAADTLADASADASASGDSISYADIDVEKPDYDASDYVVLGDYMGLAVTTTLYSATEEEYEETLLSTLESNSYYEESDKTTVEDGDLVNIDYVGTLDGEVFDGGSSEDYQLEIGSGTFIDDFEEQLIGASVGDTVEVNVTFPDSYSAEELAGEDAVFTVTINYIYNPEEVVPEYTDEFVNELTSGEYTTTEEFDEYIWNYLEEEAAETTQSALETAVQKAVFEVCEITSIPDGLVEYYVDVYYDQDAYYAEYYGLEFETYLSYFYGYSTEEEYIEALEEQITDSLIPVYLVQEAIIAAEDLEVTDEAIDDFMLDYADYYGYDDVDSFLEAYGCETTDDFISLVGEDSFNEAVLDSMVWDMIEESAVITYVEDGSSDEDTD